MRGLGIVVMMCGIVFAGALGRGRAQEACLAKATTSAQRFACNQQAMRQQDRRVDADYRSLQIRAQHDAAQQAEVRTDQRNWLAHRDAVCHKSGGAEDFACMIRETAAKADQLDARLR